jgi:hypothetical protein
MTPREIVSVVGIVKALCPAQKIDEYTPDAWAMVIGDLPFEDVKEAVVRIAGREPFISVAHIRQEVRRIRADRLERVPETALPDADPDNVREWQAALREGRVHIVEGHRPMPALTGVFRSVDDHEHAERARKELTASRQPPEE